MTIFQLSRRETPAFLPKDPLQKSVACARMTGDVLSQTFPKQSGQALAEFLTISVALVPLFLLMPMIAKYQDLAHSTLMASRYVAFDGMNRNDTMGTWKPESQLADEVRRRFFSNTDAPIKTDDVAGDFPAHRNFFWTDPHGNYLLKTIAKDVTVSYGFDYGPSHGDGFSKTEDGTAFSPVHDYLSLRARGIYTANVGLRLADLPKGFKFLEPFDTLGLTMTRSTSIVFDPWAARNPEEVERRISSREEIFPLGPLADIASTLGGVVTVIDAPAALPAPKIGKLDFWRDVVPDDRLR